MNNDYRRHVRRAWVDTHSQVIRTDPEIYLPGGLDVKEEDGDSDGNNNEGEPANRSIGAKNKAGSRTRSRFSAKVAKTAARGGPSTLGSIDDRRPDFTLVDVLVDEDLLTHPYGRHGCLYIEVKVAADEKPNPQQVVSVPFVGLLLTKSYLWIG